MPSSESRNYQRNSSPKTEAFPRPPNSAVAEVGIAKLGRKKGKYAAPKTTNTEENEIHSAVPDEARARPTSARLVEDTFEKASWSLSSKVDVKPLDPSDAPDSAEHLLHADVSTSTSPWSRAVPFARSTPKNWLEDMSDNGPRPARSASAERGGFSSKTPPASPLSRKAHPASHSPGVPSPPARRPTSDIPFRMPSQHFDASSPPPPHLPQAHFYGAPDIDLGLKARARSAGSVQEARCLCFAEFPSSSDKRQRSNHRVVLLASDDRLDVVALAKDKLTALGALEIVGGSIIEAKILTWESGADPFSQIRPLVALVVHGPRRQDPARQPTSGEVSDRDSVAGGVSAAGPPPSRFNESIEYQTTVEIHSLASQELLATLLSSQPTSGFPSIRGLPASAPPPVGCLRLDTQGNFLTVSSGTSGEVFIFGADEHQVCQFRCLGKVWTSVQTWNDRRYSNSSNSTDPDTSPADLDRGIGFSPLPILSLSSRWLAIVPPGPTSPQSLPVTVAAILTSSGIPGLESRNAPLRPPVSCSLESPDAESFINRVVRGVAQEVVRGARWFGGQSLQTWNNYWNRDPHSNSTGPMQHRNPPQSDASFPAGVFPPTHAPETRTSSAEPQNVSIIDLHGLETDSTANRADAVAPVATFEPPHGVSFLSFSPDGLFIVSATRKGDVQYVWDLKQMKYLRAGVLLTASDSDTSARSSKVTQVARFARLTPTNIVDIEWSGPTGDRFAVVTKNGTIHIFDLPLSAFQWPPIRRPLRVEPSSAPASPAVIAQPDEPTAAAGVLSSAIKLAGKTQPMLATLRGRGLSTGMGNAVGSGNTGIALASATGIRGSRAVAAGLSKSMGAATGTVKSLRHAGDNRLHLDNLAMKPTRSHVCWGHNRNSPSLLVIDGDCIRSFRISKRRSSSKPRRQPVSTIDASPTLSLSLPVSEQLAGLCTTAKNHPRHQRRGDDHNDKNKNNENRGTAVGYWTLQPPSRERQPSRVIHPLSYAEIDANAPYQPFHSDRRVTLSTYNDDLGTEQGAWVFGDEVATTRLNIRAPSLSDEEEQSNHGGASVLYRHTSMMTNSGERVAVGNDEANTTAAAAAADQIVVTTRRRKNKLPNHQSNLVPPGTDSATKTSTRMARAEMENDDGFFEDDCDVLDFAEDRV